MPASRRPGLPASRLFLPDAAAVQARSGAGHEVRGDCGESAGGGGGRWCGGKGVGEQQAGGWGWGNPLLEFLSGVRLGVPTSPEGPSRYNQRAEHKFRDGFKFQTASNYPRDWGLHVTLVSHL